MTIVYPPIGADPQAPPPRPAEQACSKRVYPEPLGDLGYLLCNLDPGHEGLCAWALRNGAPIFEKEESGGCP